MASMLFDGDPNSGLLFCSDPTFNIITLQHVNLANVRFAEQPARILREVRGRWTGAIYLRDFERPDKKTYQFLGRHRVVVKSESSLSGRLRDLNDSDHILQLTVVALASIWRIEGWWPVEMAMGCGVMFLSGRTRSSGWCGSWINVLHPVLEVIGVPFGLKSPLAINFKQDPNARTTLPI
jgi:hypothetical protein